MIGCSDLAAVLGCSPWTSRSLLWMRKKNLAPEQDASPRMKGGNFLERGILRWYEVERPTVVLVNDFSYPPVGLPDAVSDGKSEHAEQWHYKSIAHPWLTGTPDAFDVFDDLHGIVDAKMTSTPLTHWDPPPEHYRVQMVGYMLLSGLRRATLGVCFNGSNIGWVDVPWDDALAARIIVEGAAFAESLSLDACPWPIDADAAPYVWPPILARGAAVAPLTINGRSQGEVDAEWLDATAEAREASKRKAAADLSIRKAIGRLRRIIFSARGVEYRLSTSGKISRAKL